MDSKIKERLNYVKRWFSKPENLILFGIIVFAIAIRIYFHVHTSGQAVWWDEAEYMSTANKWALDVDYRINPQRPPLFQAISAVFIILGFGESLIRFLLVIFPSVFLVYVVYLLGKEMYNEKIGLIAGFLSAVSWTFVFWTTRIQPDFLSLIFQLLSVLFIWKYWKTHRDINGLYSGIFAALGFYFKVSALLVPLTIALFILIKDRLEGFKTKAYWYFLLGFLVTLIPYFIWSQISFGNPFAFRQGYSRAFTNAEPTPFGWYNLEFFYSLTRNILFALFIMGLVMSAKFLIYLDILVKEKKKILDPNIFSLLTLIVVSAFYIFYIRGTEDRWVFLWLPFIFFLSGKALIYIYTLLKKNNIGFSKILVVLIILVIGFMQLNYANNLIDSKKESYLPVKLSGEWLKENSQKEDLILSVSETQHTYYSQRHVMQLNEIEIKDLSDFDKFIESNKPAYMVVSIFEPHMPWINQWLQVNQARVEISKIYFQDKTNQNPLLAIYKFKY